MDAAPGDLCEREQLALVRQPQLEPLGAEPEAEERRGVYCKTLT
jgi:hypothetical protein